MTTCLGVARDCDGNVDSPSRNFCGRVAVTAAVQAASRGEGRPRTKAVFPPTAEAEAGLVNHELRRLPVAKLLTLDC